MKFKKRVSFLLKKQRKENGEKKWTMIYKEGNNEFPFLISVGY